MAKKEKNLMRQLIDERGIKDLAGVQAMASMRLFAVHSMTMLCL